MFKGRKFTDKEYRLYAFIQKRIFQVGYYVVLFSLRDLENQQRYEECFVIHRALENANMRYGLGLPTSTQGLTIDEASKAWESIAKKPLQMDYFYSQVQYQTKHTIQEYSLDKPQ